MDKTTNRREAIASLVKATAGVTALGVACSVSQCTTPAHSATIERAAWDRAMAKYQRAQAAYDHHHDHVWGPAWEQAEREMPWKESEGTFTVKARSGASVTYRLDRHNLDEYADHMSPAIRAGARLAKEKYLERKQVEARLNLDQLGGRMDDLSNRLNILETAVQLLAAPDLAAVLWKLERLFGEEVRANDDDFIDPWHRQFTDAIIADVRRLTGGLN